MSQRSSVELLEYTRWTLQLIERYPHREEDARIAMELKSALELYIAELEREVALTARPLRNILFPLETERQ